MADLSERLIRELEKQGVRLSFDGQLESVQDTLLPHELLSSTRASLPTPAEISLGSRGNDYGITGFYLLYLTSLGSHWQRIATVFPSVRDYEPELLFPIIFQVRQPPLGEVHLPQGWDAYVNSSHIRFAVSQYDFLHDSEQFNPLVLCKEEEVGRKNFWDSLRL